MKLKAPFPYFGGKSTVAHIVWQALGQPAHYIEPFFGSGAVLLNRPKWTLQKWKANGGYGNQVQGQGKKNAHREVLYCSPHCLNNKKTLFD